jgi:hypothetical protein
MIAALMGIPFSRAARYLGTIYRRFASGGRDICRDELDAVMGIHTLRISSCDLMRRRAAAYAVFA